MHRISLAVALFGAVAVAGCGGGAKPSTTGGTKGTAGVNFGVKINNQGPGTVADNSSPAKTCAANTTCDWTYTSGTTVVLTATNAGSNFFNGWFGECSGTGTCTLSGDSDKYVVSYFSATPQAHSNWAAGGHTGTALMCSDCHGAQLQGLGLAPTCASCHKTGTGGTAPALVTNELCSACHGQAGAQHQTRYNEFANGINPATSKFKANIVSVVTSSGTPVGAFKSTVTFTLTKAGTTTCVTPASLKQKTMYFVAYDPATKKFPNASYKQTADVDPDGTKGGQNTESMNFSYGSMTLTNAATCTFTMIKDGLPTDPLLQANAFAYGYFGDANVAGLEGNLNPGGRHYALMDNMISVAKVLNGTIDYASTATVTGCERCHGAPYSKHGYRQATVADLNDFVACKACHTDFRRGTDAGWYLGVNEPTLAPIGLTPALSLKYAYTANLMNDTHNSHAMEFAYPQSMSNCTTCHEGKLDRILTDANFTGLVCKSCHAVNNAADPGGERAPSFAGPTLATALSHHTFNWSDVYDASGVLVGPAGTLKESDGSYVACNACHADDIADGFVPGVHLDPADPKAHDGKGPILFGLEVPLFKDIHNGRIASVYAADGSKYSATVTSRIDSIVVDKTAKKVTVAFSVQNAPTGATIVPTVVGSLYGYNSKDFVVSGHGSSGTPSTRVLEYTEGATNNGPRLTVAASGSSFTAVADLSNATLFPIAWDGNLTATAKSTKLELGFLPGVTLNGTSIAVGGLSATIDLTVDGTGTPVANQYGKAIVDAGKCNKCHESLGTTFHSPSYGSAGIVGCRLCHWVGSGSSHLEMQSRSIDSFVHAIHSYQFMDSKSVDFANAFAAFEYAEHIDSVYPNFSIQNCESCHNAGTYNPPAQNRSLPGISSASWAFLNRTTNIPGYVASPLAGVPAVVTGPADRACGSCHRATMINADSATNLTNFNQHTAEWGYRVTGTGGISATTTELSTVMQGLKDAGLLP
jgi:OmcA/MtrC family decaheme c-type cytochrome